MRSILQLFSLMYMALRRPLAVWYESQLIAEAIAGAALFVAVCFNVAAVLYVFKQSVISTVFNGTPRSVLLVVGILAALAFSHAMFGGGRAERLAGEGEKKWPSLATRGVVLAASYVITSVLLMVIAALLRPS